MTLSALFNISHLLGKKERHTADRISPVLIDEHRGAAAGQKGLQSIGTPSLLILAAQRQWPALTTPSCGCGGLTSTVSKSSWQTSSHGMKEMSLVDATQPFSPARCRDSVSSDKSTKPIQSLTFPWVLRGSKIYWRRGGDSNPR